MIFIGLSLIWIVIVLYFHPQLIKTIHNIRSNENKRLDHLKKRLHINFVFRESENIQKISRWILGTGCFVSLFYKSIIFLISILILYLIFPVVWIRWVEHQRYEKFQKQLLILIPSLSSMLRSGHGIERALSEVKKTLPPPMSEEISLILKEMQLGIPLEGALEKLNERFHSENIQIFVHAVVIARKLGSSLSEAIDNISQNIMEKEKLKQQVAALTSQGKMQAYIAVCMPFMLGIILQWISPGYFEPLFSTTLGKCSIAYCLVSMSLGLYCIRRITHKEYL